MAMIIDDIERSIPDADSEAIVSRYLTSHGYIPNKIETKQLGTGIKSPDFKVYEGEEFRFYCEVKNPLLLVNDITKMFHWTTSISKIRRFIHRAVEQFHDVDHDHLFPWIIVFTSAHFQLNWTNFNDAYLGCVARNGKIISDLRQEKYVVNYNKDVNAIDGYIWCQINPLDKRIIQFVPYINLDSRLK